MIRRINRSFILPHQTSGLSKTIPVIACGEINGDTTVETFIANAIKGDILITPENSGTAFAGPFVAGDRYVVQQMQTDKHVLTHPAFVFQPKEARHVTYSAPLTQVTTVTVTTGATAKGETYFMNIDMQVHGAFRKETYFFTSRTGTETPAEVALGIFKHYWWNSYKNLSGGDSMSAYTISYGALNENSTRATVMNATAIGAIITITPKHESILSVVQVYGDGAYRTTITQSPYAQEQGSGYEVRTLEAEWNRWTGRTIDMSPQSSFDDYGIDDFMSNVALTYDCFWMPGASYDRSIAVQDHSPVNNMTLPQNFAFFAPVGSANIGVLTTYFGL